MEWFGAFSVGDGVDALRRGEGLKPNAVYVLPEIRSALVTFDDASLDRFLGLEDIGGRGNPTREGNYVLSVNVEGVTHVLLVSDPRGGLIGNWPIDDGEDVRDSVDQGSEEDDLPHDWNLQAIEAMGDTSAGLDGAGMRIAIFDAGVQYHEDFDGRLHEGESFIEGRGNPLEDLTGHGTMCAGIIGGAVTGVARGVNLYSVKMADEGGGYVHALFAGLCWAARFNMDAVSISFVSTPTTDLLPCYTAAVQSLMWHGCIVVASAGEDDYVQCPANTPGVVAVGMYSSDSEIPDESSYGGSLNQIGLVAPADTIVTTSRHGKYTILRGSSAAAPHVAGAIAKYRQRSPKAPVLEILGALSSSSTPFDKSDKWDIRGGAGLLNCERLVTQFLHDHRDHTRKSPEPSQSSGKDRNRPRPKARKHPLPNKGTLTLTLQRAVDSGPNHAIVTLVNIDSYNVTSVRLTFNKEWSSRKLPFGRYCIHARQEGLGGQMASSVVIIKRAEPPYEQSLTLRDMKDVGKITAYVRVNGASRANAYVTASEPTPSGQYSEVAWGLTNIDGMVSFDDLEDNLTYKIDAQVEPSMADSRLSMTSAPDVTFDFFTY